METKFERIDDLNACLSIHIGKEDYQEKVQEQLKNYRNKAKIPGFRQGHVPMGMLKKMVGESIIAEEVNKIASDAVYQYIKENQLDILGQPMAQEDKNEKQDLLKEPDFDLHFDLGLVPKIDLNLNTSDKVEKFKLKLDKKAIDKELESIKRQYGELVEVETASTENDSIVAKLTELDQDGKVLEGGLSEKEVTFLPEVIESKKIKKTFKNIQKGDKTQLNIFEAFNHNKAVVGQALSMPKEAVEDLGPEFEIEVVNIKKLEPAELNQALFDKVLGEGIAKSEEEFLAKIKDNLNKYYQGESEAFLDAIIEDLIEKKHTVLLPDDFLKKWLVSTKNEHYNEENIDQQYENESALLKKQLIREKFVKEFDLQITEEEFKEASLSMTMNMLRQYGMQNPDPSTIEQFEKTSRENEGYMNRVRDLVIGRKVKNEAKKMVTIKERSLTIDKFYELVKNRNEAKNKQPH